MASTFFKKLFGIKKDEESKPTIILTPPPPPTLTSPPSTYKSIEALRNQQDILERKISLLEKQIEDRKAHLKETIAKGDKAKAKNIFSEMKRKENDVEKLNVQLFNLQGLEKVLHDAKQQKEMTQTLKSATLSLRDEKQSVEEIEKVMDDAQDLLDTHQESSDILARKLAFTASSYQDDQEVEAELDALFSLEIEDKAPPVNSKSSGMAAVRPMSPINPKSKTEEDNDRIAELEMMLA